MGSSGHDLETAGACEEKGGEDGLWFSRAASRAVTFSSQGRRQDLLGGGGTVQNRGGGHMKITHAGGLGDGSPPVGSRGKAPVGGLGTKSPRS